MESFLINKTEWITGALWQHLKAKSYKDAVKTAKKQKSVLKKIQQQDYNAFCIIESKEGFQAGFVNRSNTIPLNKQKTLASLFADKYQSCVVRLVFDTGVWVCAIDDGLVEAGSDFFGSQDRADETHNEFFHHGDWDQVIDTVNHEESVQLINALSQEIGEPVKLKSLSPEIQKATLYKVIAVTVVLLLLGGGYSLYSDKKKKEEARVKAARKDAALAKLDEMNKKSQAEKLQFKKVWEQEPHANLFFDHCLSEIKSFPSVDKGWALDTVSCTKSKVVAKWERLSYGRFTDLPAKAVFNTDDPEARQADSEWIRTMTIPTRPKDTSLLKKADGAAQFYQVVKDFQLKVSAKWPAPEIRTIPAATPKDKPQKIISPYSKCLWTITVNYRPSAELMKKLAGMPGLMITEIVHNYKKQHWEIIGELYVL